MIKPNFTLIGLGFISERHIYAIQNLGGKVGVTLDIDNSKKVKNPHGSIFFNNEAAMVKRGVLSTTPYVSILTPNDLHARQAAFYAKAKKIVLIEKPSGISYQEVSELAHFPNVFVVLQLRYNERLNQLRTIWKDDPPNYIKMNFHVHRDEGYFASWKGQISRSGGLMYNIGAHYFDMMTWLLGEHMSIKDVHGDNLHSVAGQVEFAKTIVDFSLSVDAPIVEQERRLYWKIHKDKQGRPSPYDFDLTPLFTSLHGEVYKNLLGGKGIHISSCLPGIKLISDLTEKLREKNTTL